MCVCVWCVGDLIQGRGLFLIIFFCVQFVSTLQASKRYFVEGQKFYFRVTVLQATGIPHDFTDIFVQFK